MKISSELSNKIANMGFVCAVLVVGVHTPKVFGGEGERMLWGLLSHGLGKIAVPYFFAAAGYLLAAHLGGGYVREVRKRIRSLLIPLVAWCVLWWIWNFIVWILAHRELFDLPVFDGGLGTVARVLAVHPFRQPYLGVLWFVRVLFLLVLASPLMRRLANPIGIVVLWVMNGVTFPDYGVQCTSFVFTVAEGACSFFAMAWFCFGMMLRLRGIKLLVSWKLGACCGAIGMALLAFRGMPYASYSARMLTWLSIPFLLIGVWSVCPTRQWPWLLTGAAFPVYLLHMFAISLIRIVVRHCDFQLADSAWLNAFGYLCSWALAVELSIVASLALRKLFPRSAAVLFGGR